MLKNGFSYGFIQKIAVLYIVIWTISPPLQIDLVYRIAALACAALWFVLMFVRNDSVSLNKDQFYALLFLAAIIAVIYMEKQSFSVILKQIGYIMLVMCFIMNQFYRNKWDELSGILPIILILLLVFNFKTVSILLEDHTVARLLVRDDETTYQYLRQGIGGYNLIYPQVCISPLILAWIIKAFKSNKLCFIIGLVWLVSFVWYLGLAGYAIALFASAVGALLFLFYRGKNITAAALIAVILFMAIMASILYITSFREFLLDIFEGTAVERKINDLVSTEETGVTGSSIQARITRYGSSVLNIVRYPVIGSLWRDTGGGHSAFLDTFAKYGIAGAFMFSKIFYAVPAFYKKHYSNKFLTSAANASLITLLFVSFLDSFSYQFTCMLLLVAPLFLEDIVKWTGAEYE